ncbi:Putative AAA+ ATPase domain, CDR ABC transporter, ABC-2 type transporter, transmembrane [Colletotrichum destructivum]|uniref:AAA+ ATPase domain, CDR ABC transporter, ABC-2 type transporter, transmembrane n=1 Tax=Colletotrichum destructivum TaxID=34406 RepID=A0AAX4IN91_9PEZI|nr:Putative AAA+ ATPase domain, CDR ABC transporter, ABC-2 type transporter, transmembrane [Colletotrichum destructivum]
MPALGLLGPDVTLAEPNIANFDSDTTGTAPSDIEENVEEEIQDLAKRLTSLSHGDRHSLFPEPSDPTIDPKNPDFNARKWAAAFYKLQTRALLGNAPNTVGLAFSNLQVYGLGTTMDYQKTVGNFFLEAAALASWILPSRKKQRIDILHGLEGVIQSGEMLAVLGPPGSGCTTLLKTIAGETHGFYVADGATLNYQGISSEEMQTTFKGEAIYTAEFDHHFPFLTVGETLYFAARARCPQNMDLPDGISKHQYAEHLRDVVMALLGISHTKNTRVGDDFVRGVSGGERKRVSIAEAVLSYAPLQCWDNSTRGLDSANAIEFCRTLRMQADVFGCSSAVAIYQAPQEAYDLFDKVIVLYEGRQIFFGKSTDAQAYFEGLGFQCPEQKTTPDFLTSMTSFSERVVRPGWKGPTPPRSPDEFARAWKASQHRQRLLVEIDKFEHEFPFGGDTHKQFSATRRAHQSKRQRPSSPYTLSFLQQINLNLWRSFKLLISEPWMTITMLTTNFFESLIISSIFYNLSPTASSMYQRLLVIFYSILINAMGSILEILTLYGKRKIVEKHARYALYHPSAEAVAAMVVDVPYKLLNSLFINVPIYFMANLRRESAGPFFFFLLISFSVTLSMSMIFRFLGSVTKTASQALAPSTVILLALMLFSGFAIPQTYLKDWIGWIRWINPVYYAQESLALNEFVGRDFRCSEFVPGGPRYDTSSIQPNERVCDVGGAVPGVNYVDGGDHLRVVYDFADSHRWRNFGILIAITVFFMLLYLVAVELVSSERSKGEVLVFRRRALKNVKKGFNDDEALGENPPRPAVQQVDDSDSPDLAKQTSVFHWKDVCYDVQVKGETRRILSNVDGWVKPKSLTALMGVSGAGKTSLLDVLASRVTMGVVSGEMLVDGRIRDSSFQRKTGYVTQQDLHLPTATVREALSFSALLRQPQKYSREEKLAYVDTVIDLLGMQEYAEAVIGELGEGLNVEQRKRLTIGVELVARPQLLLFLDEPTSGLDSQTSWSVCDLMEKLTKSGQAILCTIHQPSASLFQRFDRLLLLAKGGRTVYFGDIGKNSHVLLDYFSRNGAPEFQPGSNPAEHMLEVIGAAPNAHTDIDWPTVWRQSPEYQAVQSELKRLSEHTDEKNSRTATEDNDQSAYAEFAAGFRVQIHQVTKRVFQQYWRSPSYILSKSILTSGSALFIGLTLVGGSNTERGLRNQMFGVFIFLAMFAQVVQQIMPLFVSQRTMYEARERPAKSYSWKAFLAANIIVEMFWNSIMAVFSFLFWYYPIRLDRNAAWADAVHSRAATLFLICWAFFLFSSTFAHLMIAGLGSAEVAGGIMNLFFILMFAFCGVLAGPNELPGFWIFMYRVNPFTYIMEGFLTVGLANAPVTCSPTELLTFSAPSGSSCGDYMAEYIRNVGGYLIDGNASECQFCGMADTNAFLSSMNMSFENRWRDFGFVWAFCVFNIAAAAFLYWVARVPKNDFKKK